MEFLIRFYRLKMMKQVKLLNYIYKIKLHNIQFNFIGHLLFPLCKQCAIEMDHTQNCTHTNINERGWTGKNIFKK